MKRIKESLLVVVTLLWLFNLAACRKEPATKNNDVPAPQTNAANASPEVYYTNAKNVMYVVGFINTGTKKAFTTILFPHSDAAKLQLPGFLGSGYYDIVITPEGAGSGITTRYTIGGINGSSNQYPATIRKAWLSMSDHTREPVSIILE